MTCYQHKLLIDSSSEIRLVNLLPGHETDPIRITITHAMLGSGVSYDALSYTWGDPNVTTTISVDDLPFKITLNLESALCHLRLHSEPRIIWIDAICIQQTDVEERDQQVRRMGSIYANSNEVLVWLGPAADDSELALDIIGEDFCEKIIQQEIIEGSDTPPERELVTTRSLNAVVKLFDRPWWRRGWIIQEVTSRDNVVLYCGHVKVSWRVILPTLESFDRRSWVDGRSKIKTRSKANDTYWDALKRSFTPPRYLFQPVGNGIEFWLSVLRKFNTTDPKDKFWIALSLSGHPPSKRYCEPQYSWSLTRTYGFIVWHLLDFHKSLRALEYCSLAMSMSLPSWIPDWRLHENNEMEPLSGWAKDHQACGNSELFYEFSDEICLHLKGFVFDCAESFPDITNGDNVIPPDKLLQEAATIGPIYKPSGELSKIALVRVSIADLNEHIINAYNFLLASAKEKEELQVPTVYPILNPDGEANPHANNWLHILSQYSQYALIGRKYFRCSRKYIGLVPAAAQKGDLISIFLGGRTPFLIRPAGEHYLMVGACYVHGIMNGEAMEDFEKMGGEIQDFYLL
jgi:hypothetical protein